MKNITLYSFLVFFMGSVIFFSCNPIVNEPKTGLPLGHSDVGRVYVRNETARSILPDFDEEYIYLFELRIIKNDNEEEKYLAYSYDLAYWNNGMYKDREYVEVPVGTWNFILRGFDEDDYPICEGIVRNVTITSNNNNTLNFRLSPITPEVVFNKDHFSMEFLDMDAGNYLINLELLNGEGKPLR